MGPPSLRFDVLTGRQVIVAPHRSQRPRAQLVEPALHHPPAGNPFQAGEEAQTRDETLALRKSGSRPNDPGWLVRVVPNEYPAVSNDAAPTGLAPESMLSSQIVCGVHEVVIESPDDRHRLTQLSAAEIARMLTAWQRRLRQLERVSSVEAVTIFRNEGFSGGASLPHVHSQILAMNVVPRQTQDRLEKNRAWRLRHESDLLQELCRAEIHDGQRVLLATDCLLVVCPFAGRVAWQVRFVPLWSEPMSFSKISVDDLLTIAGCLWSAAVAVEDCIGPVSFNVNLVHPPVASIEHGWFMELLPRTARMAGFELATDVDVVDVSPETSAAELRDRFELTVPQRDEMEPSGYVWEPEEAS